MLRKLKLIEEYQVIATDGAIGDIKDFYFDDNHWTIRYLIVDTGGLMSPNQVLISPISFKKADWNNRCFNLSLTQEKIKNSPNVDLKKPVSRQYEEDYYGYYGWPLYFGGTEMLGSVAYPMLFSESTMDEEINQKKATNDHHLRSFSEVDGYIVQGVDGEIGHITDLIVDDETWEIRYLMVDTKNWWFGRKVLISPQWAERISWQEKTIYFNLSRDKIKNGPEWWKTDAPIDRDFEKRLCKYYCQPKYLSNAKISIGTHLSP